MSDCQIEGHDWECHDAQDNSDGSIYAHVECHDCGEQRENNLIMTKQAKPCTEDSHDWECDAIDNQGNALVYLKCHICKEEAVGYLQNPTQLQPNQMSVQLGTAQVPHYPRNTFNENATPEGHIDVPIEGVQDFKGNPMKKAWRVLKHGSR